MKVQITEIEIKALTTLIGSSVATIITDRVAKLEERELINEINSTTSSERQRVLTYLERTKNGISPAFADTQREVVTVASNYLREQLHIPPLRMRALRDSLEGTKAIAVFRTSHSPITIRYWRSTSSEL